MLRSLVGSEMCIRDRVSTQSTGDSYSAMAVAAYDHDQAHQPIRSYLHRYETYLEADARDLEHDHIGRLLPDHLGRPVRNRVNTPLTSRFYKDRMDPGHGERELERMLHGGKEWMVRKKLLAHSDYDPKYNPSQYRSLSAWDHFDPALTLGQHELCCGHGNIPVMQGLPFDDPILMGARGLPVHGMENKPAYRRGPPGHVFGHCVFENECQQSGASGSVRGSPAEGKSAEVLKLEEERETCQKDHAMLEKELAQMKEEAAARPREDEDGVPNFGRRVYKCTVPPPGVGYRHTPDFANKNTDGCGPTLDQHVIADALCQGPKAVFVRCVSGRGWLPLTDPSGKRRLFEYKGLEEDIDTSNLAMSMGRKKTGQGATFAVGPDEGERVVHLK
eukprot:TRINITY_DN59671_c0_g1_i1.p1 TRINITY_DN59671_c0_g1~~TRINITY_DN59671_c0_g1_i1.p1  ORF type:complete len:389 (+),score=66.23 TRINITY_DN59671_c0_g1_i1:106-1272(+)